MKFSVKSIVYESNLARLKSSDILLNGGQFYTVFIYFTERAAFRASL